MGDACRSIEEREIDLAEREMKLALDGIKAAESEVAVMVQQINLAAKEAELIREWLRLRAAQLAARPWWRKLLGLEPSIPLVIEYTHTPQSSGKTPPAHESPQTD